MRRVLATLIFAGALVGPALALTQGVAPASNATGASQVSSGSGQVSASQVGADQIAPAASLTPDQVDGATRSTAPPPAVSNVAQGRDPLVAPVRGHDHCDPTAPAKASAAECARIQDREAAGAEEPSQPDGTTLVPSNATASGLVNDVVNGGTGTVVPLPPH